MAILEKEVEVRINSNNEKYYKELGYYIPQKTNTKGVYVIQRGTKINVKVCDLSPHSKTILTKICDHCGNKNNATYRSIVHARSNSNDGLDRCYFCSDGISYPEKFLLALLNEAKIDFEYQISFDWIQQKRYDFYLTDLDCIIEVHGRQHYDGSFESLGGRNLIDEQKNDEYKRKKAIENGISKYIVIDARKSELDFLRQSILDSELSVIIDLENIDWNNCQKEACSSFVLKTWEMFNGSKTIGEIANILKVCKETVRYYLKYGVEIGEVQYDPTKSTSKEIVQLTKELTYISEFDSAREAEKHTSISYKSISNVIRGKSRSAGGYVWMKKDEFEKIDAYKREKMISSLKPQNHSSRKVCQLDADLNLINEFESAREAERLVGAPHTSISTVCNKLRGTSGGFRWMFKEDYQLYINNKDLEILKIQNKSKSRRSNKKISIYQLDLNLKIVKEFDSITQASKETNINHNGIIKVCKSSQKTAGGYVWFYKEDYDCLKEHQKNKIKSNLLRGKEVYKFTNDMRIISKYDSIKDAARDNSVSEGGITLACKGKYQSSAGYKWMYKEDYEKYIEEKNNSLIHIG